MADKEEKGKGGGGGGGDIWETAEWLFIIAIGLYILYKIVIALFYGATSFIITYFSPDSIIRRLFADPSTQNLHRIAETTFLGWIIQFLITTIPYALIALSIVFIAISVYFYQKMMAFGTAEDAVMVKPPSDYVKEEDPSKKRWKRIIEYVQSDNPSNWRLAILEADIILDEILDVSGYHGTTVGDKLKMVERSDMPTLDDAWEAHKIRNAIAHQGDTFTLTEREAKRVIALYEKVFKDFAFL